MAAARRIEAIMHAELARVGGQEFRTPVVQPAALWDATGRYQEYGPLMLRVADRAGRPLVVAPTHEEAVADLARRAAARRSSCLMPSCCPPCGRCSDPRPAKRNPRACERRRRSHEMQNAVRCRLSGG
ncbi:MAG: hypothetical protein WCI67_14765 [Chloroflexales bacterium]